MISGVSDTVCLSQEICCCMHCRRGCHALCFDGLCAVFGASKRGEKKDDDDLMCVCVCVCVYLYMYISVYICVGVSVCVCVRV